MFTVELANEQLVFGRVHRDFAIVNSDQREVARVYGSTLGDDTEAIAQAVADTLNRVHRDFAIVNSDRREVARVYGSTFGDDTEAIAQAVADTLNKAIQEKAP
jgi:flavodoxin